jgi:hypothetical protein
MKSPLFYHFAAKEEILTFFAAISNTFLSRFLNISSVFSDPPLGVALIFATDRRYKGLCEFEFIDSTPSVYKKSAAPD